ncbi:MAG TPA: hypothetical protein VLH79_03620 [Chthonomonadales bacterium]|nr:hypothetical protein [Chthonomonadales bacterium]
MNAPSTATLARRALDAGQGILRLAPNWVPRSFCVPGRRIKLHPDDYYALGAARGGIDERWFSSTTPADNGPLTAPNEGLSRVVDADGGAGSLLLRDAVEELRGDLIGDRTWSAHGRWPMYSKFFDNKGPLPHHVHHRDEHAALVGQLGKPEAYYFPPQVNNYGADFPFTFFGLEPGTTRDQVRACLVNFTRGDNKLTNLSRAYRLEPGTGWDVPPGILHAPGSLCTYEPQRASDVFAMYQSLTGDALVPEELLWKDTPPERKGDFDYLVEVLDWEANTDPEFAAHHFMRPKPARPQAEMEADGYSEMWVCYRSHDYSAKELTVPPGRTAVVRDGAAYGLIVLQGHGTMGAWDIEAPALIRYGQLTSDEFFVSEAAARAGVRIANPSRTDPIVMLKHFGPDNPDLIVEA